MVTSPLASPGQTRARMFEEVDNTDEVVLSADGQLHDQRLGTKAAR